MLAGHEGLVMLQRMTAQNKLRARRWRRHRPGRTEQAGGKAGLSKQGSGKGGEKAAPGLRSARAGALAG